MEGHVLEEVVGGCDFTPEADAYETVGPETRWERKAILDKILTSFTRS